MFPISDSIKSGKIPFITLLIIGINIAVFYFQLTAIDEGALIFMYALVPSSVNFLRPETLIPFFTSVFLHGGFFHIATNMWFLWVFGDNVETHLGRLKFLLIYILSGLAGGFAQYLLSPASSIPVLGASGAVSGILASYMVLFPTARIKTFLLFFFFVTITEIPAFIYIFYWFIIQLFSGVASLPFEYARGGVAFWAHVGGFMTGFILTRRIRNVKRLDVIEGEIMD